MKTAYPNLERYLEAARTHVRLRRLVQPDELVRWGAFLAGMLFIIDHQYAIAFAIVLASLPASVYLRMRRLKARTAGELFKKAGEEQLPAVLAQRIRSGTLEQQLGQETLEILERCAESALAVGAEAIQAMGGPKAAEQNAKKNVQSAELLMRSAIKTLYRPLTFRTRLDQGEMQTLEDAESQLKTLRGNAAGLRTRLQQTELESEAMEAAERAQALKELGLGE